MNRGGGGGGGWQLLKLNAQDHSIEQDADPAYIITAPKNVEHCCLGAWGQIS